MPTLSSHHPFVSLPKEFCLRLSAYVVPALWLSSSMSACSRDTARTDSPHTDARAATSAHTTRRIAVAPGVTLETLDWGGRGPALVFLAGLGNTAHVFDDFAPQFADHYHVVGITRRGFGASTYVTPAKGVTTLVSDIVSVMDTLGLANAILVGHSIAGEELTEFGATRGARCAGLVYLDAAYDRTGLGAFMKTHPAPEPAPMQRADSANVDAVRAYYARVLSVSLPLDELRAGAVFDAQGRYVADVSPDSVRGRMMASVQKPDYHAVHCPSLAVYAVTSAAVQLFANFAQLDTAGQRKAREFTWDWNVFAEMARAQFRLDMNTGKVVELSQTSHYLFLQRPAEVAKAMRAFLATIH